MLIDFNYIVKKYGTPNGVIHIGAHLMEERSSYLNNNINDIVWVEANPEIYKKIKSVNDETEYVYNYIICDVDNKEMILNVTNNGESSSILELDLHKIHHPHIHVSNQIKVKCKRMDTLIRQYNLNVSKYDFLNLDIQGAELLALKGFGDVINNFKYIYTEINTNKLYKDCCLVHEIDDYLNLFNFKRVETNMSPFEWGDALYIKQ